MHKVVGYMHNSMSFSISVCGYPVSSRGFQSFCQLNDNFSTFHDKLLHLRDILLVFESILDLKINMHKHKFSLEHVDEAERKTKEYDCVVGKLPTNYLWLPLAAKYITVRAWDPVLEGLVRWRARYLFKGVAHLD